MSLIANQIAIVVTFMPATATQESRYKAVSILGAHIRAQRSTLEGASNALLAADELCSKLEQTDGRLWRTQAAPMDNPSKGGSWVVVAKC